MKKSLFLIWAASLLLTFSAFSHDTKKSPDRQPRTFRQYIWNGVNSMYFYRVLAEVQIPENPNGTVVIICPGGSYHHLDVHNEGRSTQSWFVKQNATAIILRYRTAIKNFHYPAMMQDVQRMIQLVRENPEAYGVKDQSQLKVGLIGFSAGGHLVTWAGAFGKRTNELSKIGISTKANLRPDFVIPVYPVVTMKDDIGHVWSRKSLIGKNPDDKTRTLFSMEQQIPSDMPPTYLVACHDDPVVIFENSQRLAAALQAAGTDFVFKEYPWGGHGFGMLDNKFMKAFHWNDELLIWLKAHSFL